VGCSILLHLRTPARTKLYYTDRIAVYEEIICVFYAAIAIISFIIFSIINFKNICFWVIGYFLYFHLEVTFCPEINTN